VKRLYTTAANFFRQNSDPVRAVNLHLASGQFEKAALQIEACGRELIARGQTQTILRWIEQNRLDVEIVDHTYEVIHFS
jgi:ATP/maltotriose-dependent transcriptional regulator MalT